MFAKVGLWERLYLDTFPRLARFHRPKSEMLILLIMSSFFGVVLVSLNTNLTVFFSEWEGLSFGEKVNFHAPIRIQGTFNLYR